MKVVHGSSWWSCQTSSTDINTRWESFGRFFTFNKCEEYSVWKARPKTINGGQYYPTGDRLVTSRNQPSENYQVVRGIEGHAVKTPTSATKFFCTTANQGKTVCVWGLSAGAGFVCPGTIITSSQSVAPSELARVRCIRDKFRLLQSGSADFHLAGHVKNFWPVVSTPGVAAS